MCTKSNVLELFVSCKGSMYNLFNTYINEKKKCFNRLIYVENSIPHIGCFFFNDTPISECSG